MPDNELPVTNIKAERKAWFHNILIVLGIIVLITVCCGILTSLYYCSGRPSRMTIYDDILTSTIAITQPNLQVRSGSNSVKTFFGLEANKDLEKQVGKAQIRAGRIKVSFILGRAWTPEKIWLLDRTDSKPFLKPQYTRQSGAHDYWQALEKLPEGTVAEAFIYLNRPYSTAEVLNQLEGKELLPVWFAVDTGIEADLEHPGTTSFGFPYQPVWHDKDMTTRQLSKEKRSFFRKMVTGVSSSPSVETYGDAKLRNQNFMDTLQLLQEYQKITETIAGSDLRLTERVTYLNRHGVKIYGIVVTGPSKQILQLRNEKWVTNVELGEVRLWNWD